MASRSAWRLPSRVRNCCGSSSPRSDPLAPRNRLRNFVRTSPVEGWKSHGLDESRSRNSRVPLCSPVFGADEERSAKSPANQLSKPSAGLEPATPSSPSTRRVAATCHRLWQCPVSAAFWPPMRRAAAARRRSPALPRRFHIAPRTARGAFAKCREIAVSRWGSRGAAGRAAAPRLAGHRGRAVKRRGRATAVVRPFACRRVLVVALRPITSRRRDTELGQSADAVGALQPRLVIGGCSGLACCCAAWARLAVALRERQAILPSRETNDHRGARGAVGGPMSWNPGRRRRLT